MSVSDIEIGQWIDYGKRIVEITCITPAFLIGREIVYNTYKPVHYGKQVVINTDYLKED